MTSMFQVHLLILLLPTSSATLLLVLPAEMLLQGLFLSLSLTSIKFFFFFFFLFLPSKKKLLAIVSIQKIQKYRYCI
jgi:hypothetical protein